MEEQNHIAGLILKQLRGELEEAETIELQEWADASEDNKFLYQQLTHPELLQPEVVDFYNSNKRIFEKIKAGISMPKLIPLWQKLTAAASIILILGVTYLVISNRSGKSPETANKNVPTDLIAPEKSRPVITLANGEKVYLDSAGAGQLAVQEQVKLVKLANGEIAYQTQSGAITKNIIYNTLTNPRGSDVATMTLSDGTKVWLNAGSSITYPVAFVSNERKISITGEAYFEVTHDPSKPFIVSKGETSVQVLGTHFNINAYDDEEGVKVTLLEGSVRVTQLSPAGGGDLRNTPNNKRPGVDNNVILKPGQQAIVSNPVNPLIPKILVQTNVDTDAVMAWKNGLFSLKGENIRSIMRQVSRWYDAEIEYQGDVSGIDFYGTVSRRKNVSELLLIMEKTGIVHFKVEGKKIIVSK